jgi:hypothetical protein
MTRTLAEIAAELREIADDLDRPVVAAELRGCAAEIDAAAGVAAEIVGFEAAEECQECGVGRKPEWATLKALAQNPHTALAQDGKG